MQFNFIVSGIIGILFLVASDEISTREDPIKKNDPNVPSDSTELITLFFCGDVMLGRGIDQILKYPGNPEIYEQFMRSAKGYVEIAELKNGLIPNGVDNDYIWGYALKELEKKRPDVSIINLETSITKSNDFWPRKGINYRMNPENIGCITAAKINFCSLSNNHVLDWGYDGLDETLKTLKSANVKYAGAGKTIMEAEKPAVFEIEGKGRVLVFSYGLRTSGIPLNWWATENRAGVNLLYDLSAGSVHLIKENTEKFKKEGDIVVVSIHWGGNWGYEIPGEHKQFAHQLIDKAGVDLIHGHSSHHVIGIEVYNNRLILYGCGDFLNDYEGISGHDSYRDDLGLMYFPQVNPTSGKLIRMQMIPTTIRKFRINKTSRADAKWLTEILNREGKNLGTHVQLNKDGTIILCWK